MFHPLATPTNKASTAGKKQLNEPHNVEIWAIMRQKNRSVDSLCLVFGQTLFSAFSYPTLCLTNTVLDESVLII